MVFSSGLLLLALLLVMLPSCYLCSLTGTVPPEERYFKIFPMYLHTGTQMENCALGVKQVHNLDGYHPFRVVNPHFCGNIWAIDLWHKHRSRLDEITEALNLMELTDTDLLVVSVIQYEVDVVSVATNFLSNPQSQTEVEVGTSNGTKLTAYVGEKKDPRLDLFLEVPMTQTSMKLLPGAQKFSRQNKRPRQETDKLPDDMWFFNDEEARPGDPVISPDDDCDEDGTQERTPTVLRKTLFVSAARDPPAVYLTRFYGPGKMDIKGTKLLRPNPGENSDISFRIIYDSNAGDDKPIQLNDSLTPMLFNRPEIVLNLKIGEALWVDHALVERVMLGDTDEYGYMIDGGYMDNSSVFVNPYPFVGPADFRLDKNKKKTKWMRDSVIFKGPTDTFLLRPWYSSVHAPPKYYAGLYMTRMDKSDRPKSDRCFYSNGDTVFPDMFCYFTKEGSYGLSYVLEMYLRQAVQEFYARKPPMGEEFKSVIFNRHVMSDGSFNVKKPGVVLFDGNDGLIEKNFGQVSRQEIYEYAQRP